MLELCPNTGNYWPGIKFQSLELEFGSYHDSYCHTLLLSHYSAFIVCFYCRLDSKSGSMCSSAIASPTSPTSPMSPRSPPRSPDPESLHPPARKQTSYTTFQNAVLSGIQKLLPVATGRSLCEKLLPFRFSVVGEYVIHIIVHCQIRWLSSQIWLLVIGLESILAGGICATASQVQLLAIW